MQVKSFRFNLQELGGALGDLGTLLPLMIALILINGLNATSVLLGVGLLYVVSGLYFRIPTPVQPLKAVAALAISMGVSGSVIGASGLIIGAILLLLSVTNLVKVIIRFFPQPVVKGIQLSIGLTLVTKGLDMTFSKDIFINGASSSSPIQFPVGIFLAVAAILVFFLFRFVLSRHSQHFPPSLALLTFGLSSGFAFSGFSGFAQLSPILPDIALPKAADFWLALTVLVIPQLPLTLGNSVVGTWDTAQTYFKERACRMTPRALATSLGLANIAAGLIGAMPMCHGSGGLTAHYKLGARTGGANLMIGTLFLMAGLLFGAAVLPFFSLIPLAVLGALLIIVGIYHALLVRALTAKRDLAVAGMVAAVALLTGNLAYGFAAGILSYHLISRLPQKGLSSCRVRDLPPLA
ncbi:MAG: sulfate permease [Chloroflexi bacterium]|nr:sulfate permease [Chloroflexota bacterium]